MILLTDSFLNHELKRLRRYYTVEDIKKAVSKVYTSAIELPNLGYKNGRIFKIRIPHRVAGRLILFVFVKSGTMAPLVVRLKTDKIFGKNLSLENQRAKDLIFKMLKLTMKDIESGKYRKEDL